MQAMPEGPQSLPPRKKKRKTRRGFLEVFLHKMQKPEVVLISGSMAEEPPMGFSVSPSVKLMLLQTHLAPPPVAEAAPTRAAELAAVLASLSSEGEDCRALLRRAAQSRQCDGGVEEELALAEEALDLSGAPGMTVAVLEHRVRQRPTAVEMMEANLEVYEQQLQAAAAAGAQLLVTPEDGITGFRMQREAWWPYAFDLPPAPMDQPPCDANRGHGASVPWVLQRLSCMAREHQVALVASLIDLKDCSKQPDYPGCPVPSRRDGKLLLNTAVVLDRDGCFLQKYHKANLWYEAALDASKEPTYDHDHI
eukprot:g4352.t1